ncbi:uncharacterized protein PSFLO_01109 [Pseudozyma flocculosa]|uniref:Uncharacterized protein n=1 Tax=Pseudozyma flocculosa TaxID=84751 RepID=A0A5C3ETN1_9BASI|nr:uncharacterized protein PSFLO_01109 [Pseudozyma flocculosa]
MIPLRGRAERIHLGSGNPLPRWPAPLSPDWARAVTLPPLSELSSCEAEDAARPFVEGDAAHLGLPPTTTISQSASTMSSRYSRPTDELVALGPHVYDPSTMTKVDKECILVDCCEYVDWHWARSPFGAAARRDLVAGIRQQDNWKVRYELAAKHEKEEQARAEARSLLFCVSEPWSRRRRGDGSCCASEGLPPLTPLLSPGLLHSSTVPAPPAFHLDHGFLDLKQQLALKLSVLREEWWERASVALDEALLACGVKKRSPLEAKIRALDAMASLEDSASASRNGPAPIDTDGISGDEATTAPEETAAPASNAAATADGPVVAADDGAQPAAWGSGVEESAPSDAPGLDFLSSVAAVTAPKRKASSYPLPEARLPSAKRLAPDAPRQKNRVVAGHTMAEVIAYAHARPVTTLLAEVRLDCLSPWILEAKIFLSRVQLHVGRRWNELPQHRRERPVPCDNCVRLGIKCFDMVVANPLLPSKKPVLSCTGCYERRKGCVAASVLPSGCASWEQRDCWGERPLDQLTGEQRTLALRNHTAGAAAVRESDGSGVPMPFALDLLAAYYAQGRVEDAILRLADGLPRGQLPVRLPQGMAQDICVSIVEESDAQVAAAAEREGEMVATEPEAGPSRPRTRASQVSVAEEVDDDEDDLYLEE